MLFFGGVMIGPHELADVERGTIRFIYAARVSFPWLMARVEWIPSLSASDHRHDLQRRSHLEDVD